MEQRYKAEPDGTGDYCVIDTKRNGRPTVATGLDRDEAEEAANNLNRKAKPEMQNF